tara:strand:+ start:2119 stop:2658 length:540 start_codon:yes stop_codon:yes gene_type:complete
MNNFENWNKRILTKDLIYKKKFKNFFQLPFLKKICLKMNNKKTIQNSQNIFFSIAILEIVTNQKARVCFAKRSIANFKIQKGMPLGCNLTLRKKKKLDFLRFFLFFVYPRIYVNIKRNKNSFNIGLKNLLFLPQLNIIHNNFNLNEFGFNVSFDFNTEHFLLYCSGFQIRRNKDEKTKN